MLDVAFPISFSDVPKRSQWKMEEQRRCHLLSHFYGSQGTDSQGEGLITFSKVLFHLRHMSRKSRMIHLLCYIIFFLFSQHGITATNQLVNLTDFFNGHILPTIQSQNCKSNCNRWFVYHLIS